MTCGYVNNNHLGNAMGDFFICNIKSLAEFIRGCQILVDLQSA